jgi:hypothetical protein
LEGASFSDSQAAPEGGGEQWRGVVFAADRDTEYLFPETGVVESGAGDDGLAKSGTTDGEDFGGEV